MQSVRKAAVFMEDALAFSIHGGSFAGLAVDRGSRKIEAGVFHGMWCNNIVGLGTHL